MPNAQRARPGLGSATLRGTLAGRGSACGYGQRRRNELVLGRFSDRAPFNHSAPDCTLGHHSTENDYLDELARPGGNTTGFTAFEYSISGKWVELLKEIAPRVNRVAVLRDPNIAAGIGQFAVIQSTASSTRLELSVIDTRDAGETERALTAFAREQNGGVIVTTSTSAVVIANRSFR
jgi:ABC transporter substrate binding protein